MAEATIPPKAPVISENGELLRFDRPERIVHWANATLFAILMATAAALYLPPLSAAVGRRQLVVTIHVYAGLTLPIPILLGLVGRRWGRRLRADFRRLNRWIPEDRVWLRQRGWKPTRVTGMAIGKFNAGQKLNAAFTGGAILLMLGTGSIMHWYKPWPLSWRTGATFVHDWIAIALFFTITGHIMFALADRETLTSMRTGSISQAWAKHRAPRWLAEERIAARAGAAGAAAGAAAPARSAAPAGAAAPEVPPDTPVTSSRPG